MDTTLLTAGATDIRLSPLRARLLRGAYGFVGVGLAVTRWPLLPDAKDVPRYEGTTLALLIGMSVLMLLGLRYPLRMLPMLVFESLWKLVWLGAVALPAAFHGELGEGRTETLVVCLLVVPVLVAVPWRLVWETYVLAPAERWR